MVVLQALAGPHQGFPRSRPPKRLVSFDAGPAGLVSYARCFFGL